jgi:probable F420-dependent oxidoreductase
VVGALVLDNDYRHPVVLAKEMATLDLLTSGRVELGLGAGWMRSDYEHSGIAYDAPGVRVSRFEEAITVLKGLLGEGPVDFEGEHYRIAGLDGLPKPFTAGGPPLLIGGGGPRVLGIAGREADIISVNPNMAAGEITGANALDAMAGEIDRKMGWICEGAGERIDDIELSSTLFFSAVTDSGGDLTASVATMFGVEPDDVWSTPIVAIGTVDEIVEQLEQRRERWGFSYILLNGDGFEAFAPVVARLSGT